MEHSSSTHDTDTETSVRRTRSVARILLVALLSAGVGVVAGTSAAAYNLTGCRYDPATINPISYKFQSVSATYQSAFNGARNLWNVTSAPGSFSNTTSNSRDIDVFDASYTSGNWAWVNWTCSGGEYTPNRTFVYLNTRTMNGLSASEKSRVMAHELGHSYGLAHTSGCRLMTQGSLKFTCGSMPTSDDVDGVHAIY